MTISITINGDTADDIQREMRILLNGEPQTRPVVEQTTTETEPTSTGKRPSGRTRAGTAAAAALATPAATQAISTGEERTDPAADAQDAKDEAADTAAQKGAEPAKLTHDDVKKMLGGYVQAYGMEAAQADGTGFINAPKLSAIPDTQADLAKAIIGIAKGLNDNPHKREIAGDGITAEKLAELKPLVTAATAILAVK